MASENKRGKFAKSSITQPPIARLYTLVHYRPRKAQNDWHDVGPLGRPQVAMHRNCHFSIVCDIYHHHHHHHKTYSTSIYYNTLHKSMNVSQRFNVTWSNYVANLKSNNPRLSCSDLKAENLEPSTILNLTGIVNNSAVDYSISFKFWTEFKHMTPEVL